MDFALSARAGDVCARMWDFRSTGVESDAIVTPLDELGGLEATADGADVALAWEAVTGADRYDVSRDGASLDSVDGTS